MSYFESCQKRSVPGAVATRVAILSAARDWEDQTRSLPLPVPTASQRRFTKRRSFGTLRTRAAWFLRSPLRSEFVLALLCRINVRNKQEPVGTGFPGRDSLPG